MNGTWKRFALIAALGGIVVAPVSANMSGPPREIGHLEPGQTIKDPDYLGRFYEERAKSLAIAIISRDASGRPVTGRFEARAITLLCDKEPPRDELKVKQPPILIHFRPDGREFDGSAYSISEAGDEVTILVGGKLRNHARTAKGTIVVLGHTAIEGAPYCTTAGRVSWTAARLRN